MSFNKVYQRRKKLGSAMEKESELESQKIWVPKTAPIMSFSKVYQRREKLVSAMEKESELESQKFWVPKTPVKPCQVYVKRGLRKNLGISFLARVLAEKDQQDSELLLNNSGLAVVVVAEQGQDSHGIACMYLDRVPMSSPATVSGDENNWCDESVVGAVAEDEGRNSDGFIDLIKPTDFFADCRAAPEHVIEKEPASPGEVIYPLKEQGDRKTIHESFSIATKEAEDVVSAFQVVKSMQLDLKNDTSSPESCVIQKNEKIYGVECTQPTEPLWFSVTSTPLPKQNAKKRNFSDEVEENKKPRKKPKKLRPRIYIEGKSKRLQTKIQKLAAPKRTPKPAATKPATSDNLPEKKDKRKNVMKNPYEKGKRGNNVNENLVKEQNLPEIASKLYVGADVVATVAEPMLPTEKPPETPERSPPEVIEISELRPSEVMEIASKLYVGADVVATVAEPMLPTEKPLETPERSPPEVIEISELRPSEVMEIASKLCVEADVVAIVVEPLLPTEKPPETPESRPPEVMEIVGDVVIITESNTKTSALIVLDDSYLKWSAHRMRTIKYQKNPEWNHPGLFYQSRKVGPNFPRWSKKKRMKGRRKLNMLDLFPLHYLAKKEIIRKEKSRGGRHKRIPGTKEQNENKTNLVNKCWRENSDFSHIDTGAVADAVHCMDSGHEDHGRVQPEGPEKEFNEKIEHIIQDFTSLKLIGEPKEGSKLSSFPFLVKASMAPLPSCDIISSSPSFGRSSLSGVFQYIGSAPPSSGPRGLFGLHKSHPEAGAIVPHKDGKKRKKIAGKVDIDHETRRIWNLLTNGEAEGDEDEEKWRSEREIFKGRISSFLSKMNLFLGDRKFRPWKGSVLDSVIGVFLTQNVADSLSSLAYMNLVATYPRKSTSDEGGCNPDIIPYAPYFVTEPDVNHVCQKIEEVQIEGADVTGSIEIDQDREVPSGSQESRCVTNYQDLLEEFYRSCFTDQGSISLSEEVGVERISPTSNIYRECVLNSKSQERPISLSAIGIEEKISLTSNLHTECVLNSESPDMPTENLASSPDDVVQSQGGCKPKAAVDVNTSVDKRWEDPKVGEEIDNSRTVLRKGKKGNKKNKAKMERDWEALRRKYSRPVSMDQTDTVDWEAVRHANVEELASTIKERGQNTVIAERIKGFLNRLVEDHKTLDLEWLRHVPPHDAKEYLLSFVGLGLKSVECVQLLTLQNIAFPVDVNVGRIAVRLGWVPLEPLPGNLQFHLLDEYPLMDSIQQYLWPRLCKLDQRTLYELHYHMITFGKVFCQKIKPNCRACPLRGDCRHFASKFASTRLSLPAPSKKEHEAPSVLVKTRVMLQKDASASKPISISLVESNTVTESESRDRHFEPLIEMPESPQHDPNIPDIEDFGIHKVIDDDGEDIPHIKLNNETFNENVQYFVENYLNNLQDVGNASRALVPVSAEAATPKLKKITGLRTEHTVYEIPDDHELLEGFRRREPDDQLPYLLAIWSPGETPDSCGSPKTLCSSEGSQVCGNQNCFRCESIREQDQDIVRGTILIPCKTAMNGRFPLNGTYFQVNEVFADHETSYTPLLVRRSRIWNLQRRLAYFGTSAQSIFKDLDQREVQLNFHRGYLCIKGYECQTCLPKHLAKRFHCSLNKTGKKETRQKRKTKDK